MKLWAVYTGWIGETSEAVLVEASSEEDAIARAVAAFEEEKHKRIWGTEKRNPDNFRVELVSLPHIGEFN